MDTMDALALGDSTSFSKTIGEYDVYAFAGITGDFHPNHVNEQYMAKSRFGKRVAHGALTIGYVSAAASRLTAKVPPPGCVSFRYDVKFIAPIFFGDTVTFTVIVARKDQAKRRVVLEVKCANQDGKTVAVGENTLYML
jgi:3-hydroxybutyryl-CoA dehydratase